MKNWKGFDIIVVNETWLKKEETNLFHLPSYSAVFNCRDGSTGGGSAIYIKNTLKFKLKECNPEFNKILIELQVANKPLIISTMYRPPGSPSSTFMDELEKTLHMYKNMLFVGDVNFNLLDTNSITVTEYQHIIDAYGYKIANKISPEHVTRKMSNTIIDHVITDLTPLPNIEIESTCLSDHNALLINCKVNQSTTQSSMICKEFNKMDSNKYKSTVKQMIDDASPITSIDSLIYIINEAKKLATKTLYRYVKEDSFHWITFDILELMERRDTVYKQTLEFPNNNRLKNDLLKLSNTIKSQIKTAKNNYFKNKIEKVANNTKKMWDAINTEVKGLQRTTSPTEIKLDNGRVLKTERSRML